MMSKKGYFESKIYSNVQFSIRIKEMWLLRRTSENAELNYIKLDFFGKEIWCILTGLFATTRP